MKASQIKCILENPQLVHTIMEAAFGTCVVCVNNNGDDVLLNTRGNSKG